MQVCVQIKKNAKQNANKRMKKKKKRIFGEYHAASGPCGTISPRRKRKREETRKRTKLAECTWGGGIRRMKERMRRNIGGSERDFRERI